jgi:hypothetical protein
MANFAELDSDNKVIRVLLFSNDDINARGGDDSAGAYNFVKQTPHLTDKESFTGKAGVKWVQTSVHDNFRGSYAVLGGSYDPDLDIFIDIKYFDSFTLNTKTGKWEAPIPEPENIILPNNAREFSQWWDEENQRWLRYRISDPKPSQNYAWNPTNSQWEPITLTVAS